MKTSKSLRRPPSVHIPCGAGVVTVDPGLTGTGAAYWRDWPGRGGPAVFPYARANFLVPGRGGWLERAQKLTDLLARWAGWYSPRYVILEDQSVWLDSPVSYAAARKGDIVKLAHLTGMYAEALRGAGLNTRIRLLSVREWKGQLPKAAVAGRIRARLGRTYPDHVADAVGMGLYLQGAL